MRKTIAGNETLGYLGIEVTKKLKWFGFSFEIGDYEGDEITLGLYLVFFTLWIKYSHRRVYKLCRFIGKLHKARFTRSYNSHIYITNGFNLSITVFGDHVDEDALYHSYIDIPRIFTGRSKCNTEVLETGDTEVIMPEGIYPATYTIERRTWTYPRWFSKQRDSIEIKVLTPGGIPHEGKGESSYDCGMDGTISSSVAYNGSIREATEDMALSVLKRRQKYSRLDKYLMYGTKVMETQPLVDVTRHGTA